MTGLLPAGYTKIPAFAGMTAYFFSAVICDFGDWKARGFVPQIN
jgi:hypothetical protein